MNYAPDLHKRIEQRLPLCFRRHVSTEDVLSEVWLDAVKHGESLRAMPDGRFRVWLRKSAEHNIINCGRRWFAEKRDMRREVALSSAALTNLGTVAAAQDQTPSSIQAKQELADSVQISLASLKSDYRRVLTMHYLHGEQLQTVAENMGRSPNAIGHLVDRARQKLGDRLGDVNRFFSDEFRPKRPANQDG